MPRLWSPLSLLLALGLTSCSHIIVSPRPLVTTTFPHETSDLKPDPDVHWGRLDNGLRYAILPHETPRQRASVFLLVQVGAYHERTHEQGYAHFLEHLAFRNLRGVPQGVFATIEKLGVGNSPHSNGLTGPFETEYRFDQLPVTDPTVLPATLNILRAITDGIVVEPVGVTRERDVIFNEKRARDAMMARNRADELEFLSPREADIQGNELGALFEPTRLGRRSAIGTKEALEAATPTRLRAFYDRWYRPERMILVITGQVVPGDVDRLVRETFGTLASRGRPPTEPPIEFPQPRSRLRGNASDWNAEPFMRVALGVVRPHTALDSVERRRAFLARRIAVAMLARRYQRTSQVNDPPFLSAQPLLSHIVPGAEIFLLRANARPSDWPKAIYALDFEPRRIWAQGFTPAEFQLAVKAEISSTTAAARNASLETSATLAQTLAFSIARGVVFTSAEADRALTALHLASLTEAECQKAFTELLGDDEFILSLAGPFAKDVPRPDTTYAALRDSRRAALPRYEPPPAARPFPFTDFGPPGEIEKTIRLPDIDTELIQFANGVRLNLKHTSFEPGRVSVAIRLAGGRLSCPPDLPGLDMKIFAWLMGGVRGLTLEELGISLTELNSAPNLAFTTDEFRILYRETAANLPLVLQLMAAFFTRPAFHDSLHAQQIAEQESAPLHATARGVAEAALRSRMSGSHPAVSRASIAQIRQRTLDELKAWLLPQLAEAPLEISIVGDFDRTTTLDVFARTFGALPARRTIDTVAALRTVSFPPPSFAETLTFEGTTGVATASLAWPTTSGDYPTRFRATLAAKILEQRLWQKFRVDAGDVYIVNASFVTYDQAFNPAADYLQCRLEAPPDRIEHLAALARDVSLTLAREGATAEEFERARQPLLRDLESGLRNNDWLLDLIAVAQSHAAYTEGWARAEDEFQAVTLSEINALLARWLTPDRTSQLIVKPKDS